MELYGSSSQFMALFEAISHLKLFGSFWNFFEPLWIFMDHYVHLWSLWTFTDLYGSLKTLMDLYGPFLTLLDLNGSLWTIMDLYELREQKITLFLGGPVDITRVKLKWDTWLVVSFFNLATQQPIENDYKLWIQIGI